jgi:hypothetical protein
MDLHIVDETLKEYNLTYDETCGDINRMVPVIPDDEFKEEQTYDRLFFMKNEHRDDLTIVWLTSDAKVLLVSWDEFHHVVETTPELLKIAKTELEIKQLLSFSRL